jgi:hypothetical protein
MSPVMKPSRPMDARCCSRSSDSARLRCRTLVGSGSCTMTSSFSPSDRCHSGDAGEAPHVDFVSGSLTDSPALVAGNRDIEHIAAISRFREVTMLGSRAHSGSTRRPSPRNTDKARARRRSRASVRRFRLDAMRGASPGSATRRTLSQLGCCDASFREAPRPPVLARVA